MSMLVTTPNAEYKVKFKYNLVNSKDLTCSIITTECVIGTLDPPDETNKRKFKPLFRAHAKQSEQDQFNKNIGRKLSLSRALQWISRNERKAFWDAYFTMRNGKY